LSLTTPASARRDLRELRHGVRRCQATLLPAVRAGRPCAVRLGKRVLDLQRRIAELASHSASLLYTGEWDESVAPVRGELHAIAAGIEDCTGTEPIPDPAPRPSLPGSGWSVPGGWWTAAAVVAVAVVGVLWWRA